MSFWTDLQQASYNGVPFGVDVESGRFGRRVALHEYPMRDDPWPEDLGRRAREHRITGFLLENDSIYGGGPVIQQRKAMIAAVETPGPGQLIHPTLGTLKVSVLECEFVQRRERGLLYEVQFVFVEGGLQIFPSIDTSTQDAVTAAAAAADTAASTDFLTRAESALKQGAAVVSMATSTAASWAATANGLVNDARNVFRFAASLPGPFGRFFSGKLTAFNKVTSALQTVQQTNLTVSNLIAQGSVLRNGVLTASATLKSIASTLTL